MDTINIFSWHEDYYQYVPLWQPPGDAGQVWPAGTSVSGSGSGTCMSWATSEHCVVISAVASEYFPDMSAAASEYYPDMSAATSKDFIFSSCVWLFSKHGLGGRAPTVVSSGLTC